MTPPRYQEVKAPEIPEITDDDGTHVRVVCGNFWGKNGPVDGIAADPIYLDVSVPPGPKKDAARRDHSPRVRVRVRRIGKVLQRLRSALRCRPKPVGWADTAPPSEADNRSLVLFDRGDEVTVQAGDDGDPLPAGLRKAAGRAGGVVRPHRDEHAGAAAKSVPGTGARHVSERVKHISEPAWRWWICGNRKSL